MTALTTTPAARGWWMLRRLPGWLALVGWTLIVVLPLYLLVISCFKSTAQIFSDPLSLPRTWTTINFTHAWEQARFAQYMVNSAMVSLASILLTVVLCVLAAYPLSRFTLGWGRWVLGVFLLGIMLPVRLASSEMFTLLKGLNLLDSRIGLAVVFTAIRIPFAMLIITNFMRAVPKEIDEAARVDGASELRILFSVILPQLRPAIGVVAVFTGIAVWNDLYFPLIFIFDNAKKTLPVGIAGLVGQYNTDWGMVLAGLALSAIPLFGLYLVAARQIQRAMSEGMLR